MLKTKHGMLLKQMMNQSFVISVGAQADEFKGMIRLNETGVYYWKMLEKGSTREELLQAAKRDFANIDEAVLKEDLDAFLEKIMFALEITED